MARTGKRVRIRWRSAEEHGRAAPPLGSTYVATIRLEGPKKLDGEWSVRLDSLRPEGRDASSAVMSFVSDKAPTSVLAPGVRFELFEGRWPIASGQVLSVPAVAHRSQPSALSGSTPAFTKYCQLFCHLQSLIASGQDETPEGEALRDDMDVLWQQLTSDELDHLDALTFDLSRVGVQRAYSGTVPDALHEEFKDLLSRKDIEGALRFLRENEEHLPPHDVSALRGIFWSDLGQYAPAAVFFFDAIVLKPDNAQVRVLWFRSLLKSGQREAARSEALRLVARTANPYDLLLAADVLFDSLDLQGSPTIEQDLRQIIQLTERGMESAGEIPPNSWCAAIASAAMFSKALSHEVLHQTCESIAAAVQAEQLISLPCAIAVANRVTDGKTDGNGRLREQLEEGRRLSHQAMERPDTALCAA